MASNFTRKLSRLVGTTEVTVGSYTVPAATKATVVGMSVSNVTASPITVDVALHDGTNNTYIRFGATVAVGDNIEILKDGKFNLITGDSIRVKSSAADSADVVVSLIELT